MYIYNKFFVLFVCIIINVKKIKIYKKWEKNQIISFQQKISFIHLYIRWRPFRHNKKRCLKPLHKYINRTWIYYCRLRNCAVNWKRAHTRLRNLEVGNRCQVKGAIPHKWKRSQYHPSWKQRKRQVQIKRVCLKIRSRTLKVRKS